MKQQTINYNKTDHNDRSKKIYCLFKLSSKTRDKKAEIKIRETENLCTTSDTHMSNVPCRGACGCVRARTGGLVLSVAQRNLCFPKRDSGKTPREHRNASSGRFTSAQVTLGLPPFRSSKTQIIGFFLFSLPPSLSLSALSPSFFPISSFLTSRHVGRRYVAW